MATLYKTNVESEFEPHCFVMINARNLESLKRDDIADRLLIFEVVRHSKFMSDKVLREAIVAARGAIRSELMHNLNRIVAKLKSGEQVRPSAHRLADFAALASTIASVLKLPGAMRALDKQEDKRNSFVLENDPRVNALHKYTVRSSRPEWITTGDLYREMSIDLAQTRATPRSLGKWLKNVQSNLRDQISLDFRPATQNSVEVRITVVNTASAVKEVKEEKKNPKSPPVKRKKAK